MEPQKKRDMWIPKYMLWAGIGGIILGIIMFTTFYLSGSEMFIDGNKSPYFVMSTLVMLAGLFLIVNWKNQYIIMIDQSSFQYSTIFGGKKEYRFADICGLEKNLDSWTLLIKGPNGSGRVHIESCAIISSRLEERLRRALKAAGCEDKDLFD